MNTDIYNLTKIFLFWGCCDDLVRIKVINLTRIIKNESVRMQVSFILNSIKMGDIKNYFFRQRFDINIQLFVILILAKEMVIPF